MEVSAEGEGVVGQRLEALDVIKGLDAGGGVGDEDAGELRVDVTLGNRLGTFDAGGRLHAGQATHPGDVDVSNLEGAHHGGVVGDRLVFDLEAR
ncbi:MAG: hypothetical protein WA880_08305, partial [Ornithinimicrobium sp.]